MRFSHKSHHFLRSLHKPWKLGMRVQQLVLSCARSCKTTEIERKHIMRKHRKKTYVWQHGTCCQLVYSVLFSVLPAIQSFLAQLLGKAVALTIIIGDLILTWASREQNNRETCFIYLYKAIQINEWDNIMIINDWRK